MGFSFGNIFKKAGSWFKHSAEDVYRHAIKPVYNSVLKPVGKGAIKIAAPVVTPILEATGKSGAQLIQGTTNFATKSMENVTNLQAGLGNIVSSPIIWIAVIAGAIIILPPLIQKM